MNFTKIAAAAVIMTLSATAAFAQATTTTPTAPVAPKAPVVATTPAPTTTAPAVTAPAKVKNPAQKTAKTPEGQACSAEADAKNLHGKERVKFRRSCISAARATAKKN